jgi:hypothetical protein
MKPLEDCLMEGMTRGENMLDFIPLNLTHFERESKLKCWILSWPGDITKFLEP